MPLLSIRGAAQVLRPPQDGLPFLRHDQAAAMTLAPGSLSVRDGRIAAHEHDSAAEVVLDATGCAIVPGLVDCHTHLPFAGWREGEYARRVLGASYEEIAREGGGIASSARALEQATDAAVLGQARTLAGEMLAHGTTTLECKTGYGLSPAGERRAARLGRELALAQRTTLSGLFAHAVPAGFDADGWMDQVGVLAHECDVDALDIYVESVAFTNRHLERLGAIAAREGVPLRAHVEQFATHRSVPVALAAGARSVDHLACMHADDVAPLARAECAAVLLPGAEFLGDERLAPARELADAGAICVLATDCNPGTSPILSLPLIVGLAVRRYGWSVREALLAVTLNAAWVLAMADEIGSIEVGKRADLVVLDGPVERVPYRFGRNPVAAVVIGGELAWVAEEHRRIVVRGLPASGFAGPARAPHTPHLRAPRGH